MFQRRLLANAREAIVPAAIRKDGGANFVSTRKVIDSLHSPDGRFGADPVAGRNALVAKSMDEAVAELTKRFGGDMSAWKYGQEKYHHALIRHPLSDAVNAATLAKLNVGPLPRGGDGNTVSATGGADNQASGGSLKIIADTEDWDNSVGLNTPGQSGDPDSPHYRDLFPLWARGEYFPIAYSRAKVESVRESTLRLAPPGTATQRSSAMPRPALLRAPRGTTRVALVAKNVQVMPGVAGHDPADRARGHRIVVRDALVRN